MLNMLMFVVHDDSIVTKRVVLFVSVAPPGSETVASGCETVEETSPDDKT